MANGFNLATSCHSTGWQLHNRFFRRSMLLLILVIWGMQAGLQAQSSVAPPLPAEIFLGNKRLSFQMVVKKQFTPESKFGYFSVATYAASYRNNLPENEMIMPVQFSYSVGKGIGIMAGTTINAKTGIAPVAGPQHTFAGKKLLAVSVVSFYLNKENNFQFFGLYEFKPAINRQWSVYSRVQLMYIHSLPYGTHERSYLHLRTGLKHKFLAFGMGANLDQYGTERMLKENYGIFFRWEFR
jgi:hypothetical protein